MTDEQLGVYVKLLAERLEATIELTASLFPVNPTTGVETTETSRALKPLREMNKQLWQAALTLVKTKDWPWTP